MPDLLPTSRLSLGHPNACAKALTMTTCSWARQRWFISFAKTRARSQRIQYLSTESYTYTIKIFKRNPDANQNYPRVFTRGRNQAIFYYKVWVGFFFLSLITDFRRELFSKWLWATEAKIDICFKYLSMRDLKYSLSWKLRTICITVYQYHN